MKKRKYRKQTEEKQAQKAILDYFELKKNTPKFMFWRNNSGAMKTESGGFYFFGAVGSPDIFVLKNGVLYGLEIKGSKGVQSDGQVAFGIKMNNAGGVYKVVRSLDDVQALGL